MHQCEIVNRWRCRKGCSSPTHSTHINLEEDGVISLTYIKREKVSKGVCVKAAGGPICESVMPPLTKGFFLISIIS
jgi:hypothetical protein